MSEWLVKSSKWRDLAEKLNPCEKRGNHSNSGKLGKAKYDTVEFGHIETVAKRVMFRAIPIWELG